MASKDDQHSLLSWFKTNGGYLHQDITLEYNPTFGYCYTASSRKLENEERVCTCPLSLTLSHLNVLESPPAGVRNYSQQSVCSKLVGKVDRSTIAAFFLAEQYLKGNESFWNPYIKLLPKEDELTTPLWFLDEELVYLKGTNIHSNGVAPDSTAVGLRKTMYHDQWRKGVAALNSAGISTEQFTWGLCLWAGTILSSRSFTSSMMTKSTDDSFPLLYPGIDIFNHKVGAKVVWKINDGTYSLHLAEPIEKGEQVFNNYAPKGNEELLMGYGFCITNNPCDQVGIRLGQPPPHIHAGLKSRLPDHYKSETWDADESMFYLRGSAHYTGGYLAPNSMQCLRGLPPELVISVFTIISLSSGGGDGSTQYLAETWAGTIDALLGRFEAKRNGITQWNDSLPSRAETAKARAAEIYRNGQLAILNELIEELHGFLTPIELGEVDLIEAFANTNLLDSDNTIKETGS